MPEKKAVQFPQTESVFWEDHTQVQVSTLRNLHYQLIRSLGLIQFNHLIEILKGWYKSQRRASAFRFFGGVFFLDLFLVYF